MFRNLNELDMVISDLKHNRNTLEKYVYLLGRESNSDCTLEETDAASSVTKTKLVNHLFFYSLLVLSCHVMC